MHKNSKDLTGQRFGKLVAKKPVGSRKAKVLWECLCDCGNTHIVTSMQLVRKHSTHCGCSPANVLPGDEGSFRETFRTARQGARSRKLEWTLSAEQYRNIVTQNCTYCGAEPSPYYARNRKIQVVPFFGNGIDRVDNSIAYVLENCVSCCATCNWMKNTIEVKKFLSQASKIHIHQEAIKCQTL